MPPTQAEENSPAIHQTDAATAVGTIPAVRDFDALWNISDKNEHQSATIVTVPAGEASAVNADGATGTHPATNDLCTHEPNGSHPDARRRRCRGHFFHRQRFPCPYSPDQIFHGAHGDINYHLSNPTTQGAIIVTLHGLNGTKATFQDLSNVLTSFGYRVLTFDLYGHGLSASPPLGVRHGGNYSPDFFAAQLDELLQHVALENERIMLIGFSMGCIVAAWWAGTHPDRTRKLVLLAPAGMIEKQPKAVNFVKCCKCCVPCWPFCICRCCFSKKRFVSRFPQEDQINGSASMLWNRLMWQFFEKDGGVITPFMGCVSRMPLWSSDPIFKKIGSYRKIPVLCLWGRKDTVVDVGGVKRMADCIENLHMIIFPQSSHLILVDAPKGSIASIVTFLQFPDDIRIKDYQYLLPFDSTGGYRSPKKRHPPDMSQTEYFAYLAWRPHQWVKLPKDHNRRRVGVNGRRPSVRSRNDNLSVAFDESTQAEQLLTSTYDSDQDVHGDPSSDHMAVVEDQPLRTESLTLKNSILGEQAAVKGDEIRLVVGSADKSGNNNIQTDFNRI